MGFLEDLFGGLDRQRPRPPIDVFGGQGLDAFGDLMGDGADALPPMTPFGPQGGLLGGLNSLSGGLDTFWQMPALGALGTARYGGQPTALPITWDATRLGAPRFGKKTQAAQTSQPVDTTTGTTPGASQPQAFTGAAPVGTRATVLRWLPLVQEMSAKHGVPAEVILASIDSESGGDPNAQGPTIPGVGHAWGLLQAVDKYWGHLGNLKDPRQNLDIVVGQLMAPAWKKYGKASHVRAVTYGGPGAIDSAGNIKGQLEDAGIPGWTISKDVARYLPKVAAYQAYLRGQQQAQAQPAATAPPQAANGPADLADLWAWLGGSRHTVTGRFGAQDGPYPGSGHRGMDIGTPTGTRLTSPVEGVVIAAGDVGGGYGNQVRIKTAYGSVLLGHLNSVNVRPGQQVTAGTLLGVTGSTGKSSGPHLHFELRDANDNAIDPARYYRW